MINRELKVGDKLKGTGKYGHHVGCVITITDKDKEGRCWTDSGECLNEDYLRLNFKFVEQSLEQTPFNQSDADKFKTITEKMCDTFKRKNHDYGNSFSESCDEEGLAASRIRLGDKWKRFKTLSKVEIAQVQDEKIEDTLLDMANYCVMTVMWMQGKKDKENAK